MQGILSNGRNICTVSGSQFEHLGDFLDFILKLQNNGNPPQGERMQKSMPAYNSPALIY
jgi:hypothetical protein